jgi:hypothetical protein
MGNYKKLAYCIYYISHFKKEMKIKNHRTFMNIAEKTNVIIASFYTDFCLLVFFYWT